MMKMKAKKRMRMLLMLVLMVVLLGACKSEAPSEVQSDSASPKQEESTPPSADEGEATANDVKEDAHYPVTIINYNHSKEPIEITFEKSPEKVFAVYQDSIETLLALGLEDKIVACAGLDQDVKAEYADAFEKVNYLTSFSPDKESVTMLMPDFILSWYSYFGEKKLGDVGYWHERDIKTYMMMNSGASPERKLENEYTDILNLGKIFDVEEKANAIVDDMKAKVDEVSQKAAQMSVKPRVLLMEVEKDGIRVYGDNTLGGDMIRHLGAELVTAPENHMSGEDLIQINPDVIFTVYFGSSDSISDGESAISKLADDPKYASLSAIKENRVYAISLGEIYASGTRTLDGIEKLAKGIYPGDSE